MDLQKTIILSSHFLHKFTVFFLCLVTFSQSPILFSYASPVYTLTLESYETSGSSSNFGIIFVNGVQYSLPNSVDLPEGQYSIFYYSPDEYIFSRWETTGFETLGPVTTNGNMIQLSSSGTIKARYSQGPQLYIEILSPGNDALIDENIAQIEIRITADNIPIPDSHTNFFINDTLIGTSLSDQAGIARIEYPIEAFKIYFFRVTVQKVGYKNGQSSSVTFKKRDVYRYNLSPDNEENVTDKRLFLRAQFLINNVPASDVNVLVYLDNEYLGSKETAYRGYASFEIVDIEPGSHIWYAIFESQDSFSVRSDEAFFSYYGDIHIISLDTEGEDVDYHNVPELILKTRLLSNAYPIPEMKVYFYVNNATIGYNYTDNNGYSSLLYQFYDTNETIIWHSSVSIQPNVMINSSKRIFQPFMYMPSIETNLMSPSSIKIIESYTEEIILKCNASIDSVPQENIKVDYYVNNNYIGYNYTNDNGLSTYIYNPPYDGAWYGWHVIGSKDNCFTHTSKLNSFYYPKAPTDISIISTVITDDRCDINSTQYVGYQLVWDDGSYLSDVDVVINDNIIGTTNGSGWVIVPVSHSSIGAVEYDITEILCEGVGVIQCDHYPIIIWDQVVFQLSTNRTLYDVGVNVTPSVLSWYEYDGAPFTGQYFFNMPRISSVTCQQEIYVDRIVDALHNISALRCNKIKIIWDRILLDVLTSQTRYQLGSHYLPSLIGVYEYDKSEFIGSYSIDRDSKPDAVGLFIFGDLDIKDYKYNLTNHIINNVTIVYDNILTKNNIITKYPGKYIFSITPYFSYDGKMLNTTIMVNGNSIKYDAVKCAYVTILNSWSLSHRFDIHIEYDNFDDIDLVKTKLHFENIYCLIGFSLTPISMIILYAILHPTQLV